MKKVGTESDVLSPLHYILDIFENSTRRLLSSDQPWSSVAYHADFAAQIGVTEAFGDIHSIERDWGTLNQSIPHEDRFIKFSPRTILPQALSNSASMNDGRFEKIDILVVKFL